MTIDPIGTTSVWCYLPGTSLGAVVVETCFCFIHLGRRSLFHHSHMERLEHRALANEQSMLLSGFGRCRQAGAEHGAGMGAVERAPVHTTLFLYSINKALLSHALGANSTDSLPKSGLLGDLTSSMGALPLPPAHPHPPMFSCAVGAGAVGGSQGSRGYLVFTAHRFS